MDKDHRLDAPNNDALRDIEQLEDRSQLAAVYPHKHDDWEGTDLMSRDDRIQKRDDEQSSIHTSIRPWFVVIGFLIPLPFLLYSLLIAGIAQLGITIEGMILFPLGLTIGIFGFISYKAIKGVYDIFYNHSIKATPFVVALLLLLVLSIHPVYTATTAYYTDVHFLNMLLICGVLTALSILYSGLLLIIWTTRRLSGRLKFLSIGAVALLIILIELTQNIHLLLP